MEKTLTITLTNAELTTILGGKLTASFGDVYFNEEKVSDMMAEDESVAHEMGELEDTIIQAVHSAFNATILKDTNPDDASIRLTGINLFRSGTPLKAEIQFDIK